MAAPSLLQSMGLFNQMPPQAASAKPNRRTVKKVSWAPENNLCQVVDKFLIHKQSVLSSDEYQEPK